ncbi:MAG: hypothetical protein R3C68_14275 [Myxococcota bacterium]
MVIFLSDEDDCSFKNTVAYEAAAEQHGPVEQRTKLCEPDACYSWSQPGIVYSLFQPVPYDGAQRTSVDPPFPDPVATFFRQ